MAVVVGYYQDCWGRERGNRGLWGERRSRRDGSYGYGGWALSCLASCGERSVMCVMVVRSEKACPVPRLVGRK